MRQRLGIKIKAEKATVLSETTVSRYLKDIIPFPINPAPPTLLVSRKFLIEVYHAPSMLLLQESKNGGHNFMFPTLDINPDMPASPGNLGLLLSCRRGMLDLTWTLFTRVQLNPAKWEYLGKYRCAHVGQLSSTEFSQQNEKVGNLTVRCCDLATHRQAGEEQLGNQNFDGTVGAISKNACPNLVKEDEARVDRRQNRRGGCADQDG
jgi:hypothetical protein